MLKHSDRMLERSDWLLKRSDRMLEHSDWLLERSDRMLERSDCILIAPAIGFLRLKQRTGR
jgi:hypothetical protein